MRKKIVAGNWKMNLTSEEALKLNTAIDTFVAKNEPKCEVIHFSPYIYLNEGINSVESIAIGAQNGYPEKNGAFTGEISMYQLKEIGVRNILIGHSERRQIFKETDAFLKSKVDAATNLDLTIFFCCGETISQRENGKHVATVITQLENSIFHLSEEQFKNVVIAYEPIWAIGTGKTASPAQANEMHQAIRAAIQKNYNAEIAKKTSIIYGGSCKPTNASELFHQSDIDGGLIGGASLKSEDFMSIISTYK
ncbi:triose-phosphate isomerase [Brumimicrobium salinarum]|uniref:Triosephosphate isomerase n=1 Tax=Brumimicrobium salinarum TaxID=2058658 RepID=A0A2I0QZ08_9FLAO|nr:triose-phosphate isomerase [Brumimicrobium salinarum]PKR79539.1 triose-phosphate isomerase [Brumimicrobium salinarum]